LGHERGPLAVEVDEVLRDDLPLGGVRREERGGAPPGEDVTELPADVPAVLEGDVHALPGLGAVRVAGVAGDEDAGQLGALALGRDVVELVGDAVAHLVDAPPGDVPDVERVGPEDRVRLGDDLLERRLAHRGGALLGDLAEVDVHAEEVPALARDEEDAARGRLDRALEADVGEVGDGEDVHDAPRVVGLLADVPAADLPAHLAVGAVAADDVLDPDGADLALAGTGDVLEPHLDGVLALTGVREAEELDAVVRRHARRGVRHVLVEVVDDPRLVDDEVRELADAARVVLRAGGAHDVVVVLRVRLPEGHLGDAVGLVGETTGEAERLEGLDAPRLDPVRVADLQAVRAAVDEPRVGLGELRQLRRGDGPGGPGADDEDVELVRQLRRAVEADPRGGLDPRVRRDVAVVVELHGTPPSLRGARGPAV